jgi:HEPN domain-containing protein
MNRIDFQELAEVRIAEAEALFRQGKHDGAYYLAGYAVECALKACIARQTNQHDFPPKPDTVREYYSHKFKDLLKVAGLTDIHKADTLADPRFNANWLIVLQWSEQSRYERRSQPEAENMIAAITDANHGVRPWIKRYW